MDGPGRQTGSVFLRIQLDRSKNLLNTLREAISTRLPTYASTPPAIVPAINECSGFSSLSVMTNGGIVQVVRSSVTFFGTLKNPFRFTQSLDFRSNVHGRQTLLKHLDCPEKDDYRLQSWNNVARFTDYFPRLDEFRTLLVRHVIRIHISERSRLYGGMDSLSHFRVRLFDLRAIVNTMRASIFLSFLFLLKRRD